MEQTTAKKSTKSAAANARQTSYDDYYYTPTPAMIEAAKQDYALRVYAFTQNQLIRAKSESNSEKQQTEYKFTSIPEYKCKLTIW
ncbi:12641_t:CDS:2 [Ambispora gerdemannii]|uniref:12641_t:CDS:1 n=1 Tax=Ambispora gerdemannii TaxID=144530 RepID=A0A9N8WE46_9GLOM|nr:12641_t:CDS:2 [Ambispora gerdemannii]